MNRIVLDKTGTLTEGHPVVGDIVPAGGNTEDLLAVAAAAEASSEHPLAQAIIKATFERSIVPPDVEQFEAVPGQGVRARIGEHTVVVGSPRFVAEEGVELETLAARITHLEEAGQTVIAVGRDGCALGIVALGDPLRTEARETVAALKSVAQLHRFGRHDDRDRGLFPHAMLM